MLFRDRKEAGTKLAQALKDFKDQSHTYVIALPRGGVVVGFEIAHALHLPLDIVCPRKVGAPFDPELAIGAVTESGETILSEKLISELQIPPSYIQSAIEEEKERALARLNYYRKGRTPRVLRDQRVILVDDGLATGATMQAAILTVKAEKAKEIIVAIPVAPLETLEKLKKECHQIICLATPIPFYSVGQFYTQFDQTTDEEVTALLN